MKTHSVDIDLVEMSLDVIKFAISRITETDPRLGFPVSEKDLKRKVGETITPSGIGGEKAFQIFQDILVKASVSIDHPRHLAFVPAAPTRAAVMFDLVTAASNVHGAFWLEGAGCIFAENQAMEWLVSLTGLPETATGVFTSGGTAANLSAITVAREYWRRDKPEKERGILIAARTAHSSIQTMAKVIDADVISVETEREFTGKDLARTLTGLPESERRRVFAVIATAGTTNAGIVDELDTIAKICERESLWMHVDAAYGGGALSSEILREQFQGIERSDSITIDPHKWLFAPYDCGAVIYRNPELARQTHMQEGSYLDIISDEGADGFNPADYQIQLTRRTRGLPLWFSLAMYGTERYRISVERGVELAGIAASKIEKSDYLELVHGPSLSIVIFRRKGWTSTDYNEWTYRNHREGIALVAPTKWRNGSEKETVARFCFINPDTTEEDIELILESMA